MSKRGSWSRGFFLVRGAGSGPAGLGVMVRGWALAQQGQQAEGMALLRRGLAAWQVTGAELNTPNYLAVLAEAYATVGEPKAGLPLLREALAIVQKTRERWGEAEIYRIKGDLLGMRPWEDHGEAEACFRRAIDLAGRQQAKSLALRAAISLSRLKRGQGEREVARRVLADVYDWFTEGFDTHDLREARALLEALS